MSREYEIKQTLIKIALWPTSRHEKLGQQNFSVLFNNQNKHTLNEFV